MRGNEGFGIPRKFFFSSALLLHISIFMLSFFFLLQPFFVWLFLVDFVSLETLRIHEMQDAAVVRSRRSSFHTNDLNCK